MVEDRISAVETELLATSEEISGKTEDEGWRVSDTARVSLDGKAVSGAESSEGDVRLADAWGPKELGAGID